MIDISTPKNFWNRLDLVLKYVAITSVFCLIFVWAHKAIFDLDIWLHLKTGEFILQNKTIPSRDIFSFTLQGKPWIDHSWLFQVVSYLIYSKWQAEGLIFLQSFIIVLSFLVLFLMGYKTIKSYMEVAILTVVTAYASLSRFNIRPEIFSLFFFSLYLYILRFHIDKKRIWLLVPIQVLWVNFHGYFFLGPLLIFLFIIAEGLRRRIKFSALKWNKEFILSDATYIRLKKLFFIVALSCLLNPNGIKGALYPIYVAAEVLLGKTKVFLQYIQELQPTFTKSGASRFYFYYIIIIFCFLFMFINLKRLKIIEILLVLFFFLFSFTLRHIVFFSFIAYIIIISYFSQTLRKISLNIKATTPFRQTYYLLFKYGIAIALIVWIGFRVNMALDQTYYDFQNKELKSLLSGIDLRRYPKKAVDFILENNIGPNMFNDFNSGAYLVGRVYPKRRVFIDGRTEVYGPEFFRQYMDSMEGDIPAFEGIISKYQITAILLNMTSTPPPKIISYIYKSQQWKLVFLDDSAVVFLKDTPSHQELIKRYKIDLNKYVVPAADLKALWLKHPYPWPYIKRATLFNFLKEDALVIAESKEALRIMPDCVRAYHLLGKVYLRKGRYEEARENLRCAAVLLPADVEILIDLGICLKELKETESAIKTLKGAIKFDKRYAPIYYHLGGVYLDMDNKPKAIQALNKALKLAKQDKELRKKTEDKLKEAERK